MSGDRWTWVAGVVTVFGLSAGPEAEGAPPGAPFEVFSDWSYYNRTGWLALQNGRLDRAEEAFRLAIKGLRPYEATERVVLARTYADLARVLYVKGKAVEAEPLAAWAVAVRETAPGERSAPLCQTLELLADVRITLKKDAEAEPVLRRLVSVKESVLGATHPDLIPAVSALADLYDRQGKVAEAEPLYRRALSLRAANSAEGLRQAEEQDVRAEFLRTLMAADAGTPAGGQSFAARTAQVRRLETSAEALREASSESLGAAVTTENFSKLLRRSGRTSEADDLQARAKAIRDAVETRAAGLRSASSR